MNAPAMIDRRRVLAGGGALIVSFSLPSALAQQQDAPAAVPAPSPPGSLKNSPYLDAWIRIDDTRARVSARGIEEHAVVAVLCCPEFEGLLAALRGPLRAIHRAARLMDTADASTTADRSAR